MKVSLFQVLELWAWCWRCWTNPECTNSLQCLTTSPFLVWHLVISPLPGLGKLSVLTTEFSDMELDLLEGWSGVEDSGKEGLGDLCNGMVETVAVRAGDHGSCSHTVMCLLLGRDILMMCRGDSWDCGWCVRHKRGRNRGPLSSLGAWSVGAVIEVDRDLNNKCVLYCLPFWHNYFLRRIGRRWVLLCVNTWILFWRYSGCRQTLW